MNKVGYIIEYTPGCDSVKLHRSLAKEIIVTSSRKTGKSYALIYEIIKRAWNNTSGLDVLVCAPSFSMLTAVLETPMIDKLGRLRLLKQHSYSKHNTILQNGNVIRFRSLDNPDSIRGLTCCLVAIDEAAFCNEASLDIIKPVLAVTTPNQTQPNTLIMVTTPNGVNNWLYERYYSSSAPVHPWQERLKFTKHNNPYLDESELDAMRAMLDPLMVKQELEGEFVNLTANQVYYQFATANIQDCGEPDRNTYHLHIGIDYNIGVMAYVVCQKIKDVIYVYDEGVGLNSVQDLGQALLQKYGPINTILIDDASGNARNQADGKTNRQILRQIGFHSLYAPNANPRIEKRLAVVNGHFLNGFGERRLLIHPRCKHLINELETLSYKKKSTDIDDRGNTAGHITSALGYVVYYLSGGLVPRNTNQPKYQPQLF